MARPRPRSEVSVALFTMSEPVPTELWMLKDGSTVEVKHVATTEGFPPIFMVEMVAPAAKSAYKTGQRTNCNLADFQQLIGQAPPKAAEPSPVAAPADYTTPKAARKAAKAKQTKLPGMTHPDDEVWEKKVAAYVETRDERMALNKTEKQMNNELLAMLKAADKTELQVDGHIVKIVAKDERVKVKRVEDEAADEDGDED